MLKLRANAKAQRRTRATEKANRIAVHVDKKADKTDPDQWMRLLEPFLPTSLRFAGSQQPTIPVNLQAIVTIIDRARYFVENEFDLLKYMLLSYGREQAVLYLLDEMLKQIHLSSTSSIDPPSNLHWPPSLFAGDHNGSIELQAPHPSTVSHASLENRYGQGSPSGMTAEATSPLALRSIWLFLGQTTIAATKSGLRESQQIMSTVYRALAKLHHHNLIPAAVYEFQTSPYSTVVQRPPILHLLTSRILTTLSDAVWRSQQDETLAKAAADGASIENLYRDPPGGRFRLRVRDLGPEVWLEFILWCCVEARFSSTGAKIIEALRKETENPWFAVSWTSDNHDTSTSLVDWDRVKARTGGTVGRIEGYSRDQPLADVPPRTISVEVVLALTEGLLSARDLGTQHRKDAMKSLAIPIKSLISFLEPHSLPAEYFDYLTVRVFQVEALVIDDVPANLELWINTMADLRDMEATHVPKPKPIGLDYQTVVSQSLLAPGILQQVLLAYIRCDRYLQALDVFSKLQLYIDTSKVQSMLAFVQSSREATEQFFTTRRSTEHKEFVSSHGQPPNFILAAFLQNMVLNKQMDVARWMIYSDDVDGPIIPRQAYSNLSVALALARLSIELSDDTIMHRIRSVAETWRFKPALKLYRAVADAHIKRLDFLRAELALVQAQSSVAGGYSPTNLSMLMGTIIRLEKLGLPSLSAENEGRLQRATRLLRSILRGRFDGTKGDFYLAQILLFRQQVGQLLRICLNLPRSTLSGIAGEYGRAFPSANVACLPPAVFNTLLTAIVDAYGAEEGRRIWEIFCQDPRIYRETSPEQEPLELFLTERDMSEDRDVSQLIGESGQNQGHDFLDATARDVDVASDENDMDVNNVYATTSLEQEDDEGPPLSEFSFEADLENFDFIATKSPKRTRRDRQAVSSVRDTADPGGTQHVLDDQADPEHNPVVVPNIQTMRIILRQALKDEDSGLHSVRNELDAISGQGSAQSEHLHISVTKPDREQHFHSSEPTDQEDIITWAISYMRKIGFTKSDAQREVAAILELEPPTIDESLENDVHNTEDDVDVQTRPERDPIRIRKHFVSGANAESRLGTRRALWQQLSSEPRQDSHNMVE